MMKIFLESNKLNDRKYHQIVEMSKNKTISHLTCLHFKIK